MQTLTLKLDQLGDDATRGGAQTAALQIFFGRQVVKALDFLDRLQAFHFRLGGGQSKFAVLQILATDALVGLVNLAGRLGLYQRRFHTRFGCHHFSLALPLRKTPLDFQFLGATVQMQQHLPRSNHGALLHQQVGNAPRH